VTIYAVIIYPTFPLDVAITMVRALITIILALIALAPAALSIRDDPGTGLVGGSAGSGEVLIHTLWGSAPLARIDLIMPDITTIDRTDHWIVQFDSPVGAAERTSLRREGLEVLAYLPDFAFVVDIGDRSYVPEDILPGVVGTRPFPLAMKIGPDAFALFSDPDLGGFDEFTVEMFTDDRDARERLGSVANVIEWAKDTRAIVSASFDPIRLISVDEVMWIEPRADLVLHNDIATGIMDVDTAWQTLGLDGTGQVVGISDSGLDTGVDDHNVTGDIHLDVDGRVTFKNYAGTAPDDQHGHGTHVSGSVAGNGARSNGVIKGPAYNASIRFQGIMTDAAQVSTPGNLSILFKDSYGAGARVHTNSWGYEGAFWWGAYTADCFDVDWSMFHYPTMLILFSAGNEGTDSEPNGKVDPGSVSPPATAKSTLTVGASENTRSNGLSATWSWFGFSTNPIRNDPVSNNSRGLAAFSSRGPTDDSRLKPEIVAPGTNILSLRSTVGNMGNWASYNSTYHFMGGTSMSCPLTAGMAALVRQYLVEYKGYSDPSGALVKAAIVNGGVDMTPGQFGAANPTTREINSRPDNDQGWGRASLTGAVAPEGGHAAFMEDLDGLSTGDNVSRMLKVGDDKELRVTLAWADYPGSYFAGKQLVNDLDLVLRAPDGTMFFGNDLSAPFDDSPDRINPTETVTVLDPMEGWWRVEVHAYNVPLGSQHFGLAASGNITDLLTDSIIFDRAYYSTDDSPVTVELTAMALSGTGPITVRVNSTSHPSGIDLDLAEMQEGIFRGVLLTINRTTADPGRLYTRHNDTLMTEYTNLGVCVSCNASAKAVSPVRAYLYPNPDHLLTYSYLDRLKVRIRSEKGADIRWTLENTVYHDIPAYDDGGPFSGDDLKNDGNFSGDLLIDRQMDTTSRLLLIARDPFLGDLIYPQLSIRIDTSRPRFPRGLTAIPLDEGNSVILQWTKDNVTDRERYSLFINDTLGPPTLEEDRWIEISGIPPDQTFYIARNLADGTMYHFRVASVNGSGVRSSLSSWASVVPRDLIAPDISLIDRSTVLSNIARFEFLADPDTVLVELEHYLDLNGNGLSDDGGEYTLAGSSANATVSWDTRLDSGGPGNATSILLRYRATDEAPNISPWTYLTGYSVDNTGPLSLILDEAVEPLTRFPSRTVTGSTEALSNIFVEQNGLLVRKVKASAQGSFYFTLDLTEGENQIQIEAYDRYGAGPTSISFEITLDTTYPVVAIQSAIDPGGSIDIGTDGFLMSSASFDPGPDPIFNTIASITWEIRGNGLIDTSEGNDTYLFVPEDLLTYRIKLIVSDMAGNRNETELSVQVKDLTPPQPEIEGPIEFDEDSFVEFTVKEGFDNDPALNSSNDAFFWTVRNDKGWERTYTRSTAAFIIPDPGEYLISLTVRDRGGNLGNASVQAVVKDITPPAGSILGPAQPYVGDDASYNTTFEDNDPFFPAGIRIVWRIIYRDPPGVSVMEKEVEGTFLNVTFDVSGNYTITRSLTDRSGNEKTDTYEIRVLERPENLDPNGEGRLSALIFAIVVGIALVGALVGVGFLYFRKKPRITDVDWEDDDWDMEDEE